MPIRTYQSKETLGQPKDALILPVLRDALAAIKKGKALKERRPKKAN